MYKMICIQCGKEFIGKTRNRKTCSEECRKARKAEHVKLVRTRHRLERTAVCGNCGKLFHPDKKHRHYCSDLCAARGYNKVKHLLGLTREYDRYDWSGEDMADVPSSKKLEQGQVAYNKSVRKRREENMRLLAEDVAEADRLGMSYGMYMATRSAK